MRPKGLEAIFARHPATAGCPGRAMKGNRSGALCADAHGSPSLAGRAPEGIDARNLRKAVKERFDILLPATGSPQGKVFRIALGSSATRDPAHRRRRPIGGHLLARWELANGSALVRGWAAAAVELAKG